MSKFYLLLWSRWSLRLTLETLLMAFIFSALITFYIYTQKGFVSLDMAASQALFEIFKFWFAPFWSLSLLIALFRSVKYIFNSCFDGYKLELLTCQKEKISEVIEVIGYGDLVKVWRKWLLLIIWFVGAEMILALLLTTLFGNYTSTFEWFNIYVLYLFILVAGYFSFMILGSRCKRVRLVKC